MAKKKIQKSFECPVCGLTIINRKTNFLRHINLHGKEQNRNKCAICHKTYQTKGNVKLHLINIHKLSDSEINEQLKKLEIVPEPAKSVYFFILIQMNFHVNTET